MGENEIHLHPKKLKDLVRDLTWLHERDGRQLKILICQGPSGALVSETLESVCLNHLGKDAHYIHTENIFNVSDFHTILQSRAAAEQSNQYRPCFILQNITPLGHNTVQVLYTLLDDLGTYGGPAAGLIVCLFHPDKALALAQKSSLLLQRGHTKSTEISVHEFRPVADTYIKQDLVARLKSKYHRTIKRRDHSFLARIVNAAAGDRTQARILLDLYMTTSALPEDQKDPHLDVMHAIGRILAGKRAPYPSVEIESEAACLRSQLQAWRKNSHTCWRQQMDLYWRLQFHPWQFVKFVRDKIATGPKHSTHDTMAAINLRPHILPHGEKCDNEVLTQVLARPPTYFDLKESIGIVDIATQRQVASMVQQNLPNRLQSADDIAIALQDFSILESAGGSADQIIAQCQCVYDAVSVSSEVERNFSACFFEAPLTRKVNEERRTLTAKALNDWQGSTKGSIDRIQVLSDVINYGVSVDETVRSHPCRFDDLNDLDDFEEIEEIM